MGNALGVAGEGHREQQWSREKARKPTLGTWLLPVVECDLEQEIGFL